MTAISVTKARANLYRLVDQANEESQTITITGKRGNAVLIGEDDWSAIQETLYLNSIPGMSQSVIEADQEGIEAASNRLDW
ncbi:type II toxin-antitoxin system Phd/YefM family antitoxin [Varibaculum vaginae]|uniref:type II toxin-antitoxin system Phd/YefM family antitoxin n=1 Tax=Varibaculum vaginae TaxID=2364797 RepID=UPI000F0836E3|nr:type II toxin-antitoxin system Phd/YefM family antitoxin [Varibaculum vaginae]